MLNEDAVQYAIENTRILHPPQRRIDTFGSTTFRFFLVSELMDSANEVRVRDGRLHAERPSIITPGHLQRTLTEGFSERGEAFIEWLLDHAKDMAVVKYGFQFRKTDVTEAIVHDPLADVVARVRERVEYSDDPLSAVIQGVDEGWEICLLKFATDMIQQSAGDNFGDFRRRGWL